MEESQQYYNKNEFGVLPGRNLNDQFFHGRGDECYLFQYKENEELVISNWDFHGDINTQCTNAKLSGIFFDDCVLRRYVCQGHNLEYPQQETFEKFPLKEFEGQFFHGKGEENYMYQYKNNSELIKEEWDFHGDIKNYCNNAKLKAELFDDNNIQKRYQCMGHQTNNPWLSNLKQRISTLE